MKERSVSGYWQKLLILSLFNYACLRKDTAMMKFNKSLLVAVMALSAVAHNSFAKSHKKSNIDPVVGTYAVNECVPVGPNASPVAYYGNATIFADGTLIFQDTEAAQQGVFGTIAHGRWEKIGKRRYKQVSTAVILRNPKVPEGFRATFEGEWELSDDCQTLTGINTVVRGYALPDNTFSGEQIFPEFCIAYQGKRLKYSGLPSPCTDNSLSCIK